jgi:hypothetical protein
LKKKNKILEYRWKADVPNFKMPLKVTLSKGKFEWIYPAAEWKTIETAFSKKDTVQIAEEEFYFEKRLLLK